MTDKDEALRIINETLAERKRPPLDMPEARTRARAQSISPATTISLCTVRLSCSDGRKGSVGTGFLYNFDVSADCGNGLEKIKWPMLVTNKHVVSNMSTFKTRFTVMPRGSVISDTAVGLDDIHTELCMTEMQAAVINHPDPDVDVCILPIMDLLRQIPDQMEPRHYFLDRSCNLTPEEKALIRPIEPIVMVGYPTGLWDEHANRPLIRRGLTASHPLLHWNRKRQFVIDAACFPGSSGSPVFLYEDGMYRTTDGGFLPGSRARFLGLLFAGPTFTQDGRIDQRTIPTAVTSVPVIETMMNLGFVVHAETLDDFIPLLEQKFAANRLTWKA